VPLLLEDVALVRVLIDARVCVRSCSRVVQDVPLQQRLFDVFDLDQNGTLNKSELLRGLALLCRGTMEERLMLTFDAYDLKERYANRACL
jgi:hypothetical protein